MFTPVNRWKHILVRVLVVAQLLSAAPLASAFATADHAGAAPCAGTMDMANVPADTHDCPCCPDGSGSQRDCLVSCTLAFAALPDAFVISRAPVPASRFEAAPSAPLRSLSDPPLKPPPIR
jgi:hypothetical protein